ncbi:hypothetical protein [Dactylosporangium sp. CA-139066]|uniref:hypothetical protein n=1 Tax=Dactylosporangium sp. CA-139066 TaxID=3239930 RepID=UPI003D90DF31
MTATDRASVAERAGTRPSLTGPAVFDAAAAVRDAITVEIRGCRYPVSPVATGFLAVHVRAPADLAVVARALALGRAVAVTGDHAAAADLAAATGSRFTGHGPVCFLVPEAFVRRHAAVLRRRLPQTPAGPPHPIAQRVSAVPISAGLLPVRPATRSALARARAVVMTDWTAGNTLPLSGLRIDAPRVTVPYDIDDYDATIAGFNRALDRLRDAGVTEVALLVEGNPDTLDVLDGIALHRRTVEVVPGVPVALAAAGEYARSLPADPFRTGLAYLSGLPHRHGQTRAELHEELAAYLSAGVTCVLVEMTFGDLQTAMHAIDRTGEARRLALLTDLWSPAPSILVVDADLAGAASVRRARARGTLNTVLIHAAQG